MDRREFLQGSAFAMAATIAEGRATKKLPAKQNLLFLTVDDMNWSMPGFTGGNRLCLTPNLDALAERSHQFLGNRTIAPICQPSREAMMTGRYAQHSGALGFQPVFEGTPTLVTSLRAAGYFTAAIHKLEHMQPPSSFPWDFSVPGSNRAPSEYVAAVESAMAQARAAHKPFLINCNLNDPHRPFYGSREAAGMDHNESGEYAIARLITPDQVEIPPFLEDLPHIREELAQYYNSVQRMDKTLGQVLAALDRAPEAEGTLVFFSADHGMPFPFSKATVYDNGTRTPALLRLPRQTKSHIHKELSMNIDYLPTHLDLLGVPRPAGVDGASWAPAILGTGTMPHREFLFTQVNTVNGGAAFPQRCVQDQRWSLLFMSWPDGEKKFHVESMAGLTYKAMKAAAERDPAIAKRVAQYDFGVSLALYDRKRDPGQRHNVLDAPENKTRVAQMIAALRDQMQRCGDSQLPKLDVFLSGSGQEGSARPASALS